MQNSVQNWDSAVLGIATFATILAAATSAGIFAVTARQESYPEWARVVAASLTAISLLAYVATITFSMATLFRETQAAQRAIAAWTAIAVLAQTYTALLAAAVLIYFPLLERIRE